MNYTIEITPAALEMLKNVQDRRVRQKIVESIDGLAQEPDKKGKALTADLGSYRSLRAVGQRYRVIYRVRGDKVIVVVVAVGIRKEGDKKDIYALAKKLIRARLLEPLTEEESLRDDQPDAPDADDEP